MVKYLALITIIAITVIVGAESSKINFKEILKQNVHINSSQINHGKELDKDTLTHTTTIVSIDEKNQIPYICMGSILSKNFVLTAAQCFDGTTITGVYADYDVDGEPKYMNEIKQSDIKKHPKYNAKTLENDLAIVSLKSKPLSLSKNVKSVVLPTKTIDLTGKTLRIPKWNGKIEGPGEIKLSLAYIDVPVTKQDVCKKVNGARVNDQTFCVSLPKDDGICFTDIGSGATLLQNKHTLVGVVSFDRKDLCKFNTPAVLMKVPSYLDWIKSNSE